MRPEGFYNLREFSRQDKLECYAAIYELSSLRRAWSVENKSKGVYLTRFFSVLWRWSVDRYSAETLTDISADSVNRYPTEGRKNYTSSFSLKESHCQVSFSAHLTTTDTSVKLIPGLIPAVVHSFCLTRYKLREHLSI